MNETNFEVQVKRSVDNEANVYCVAKNKVQKMHMCVLLAMKILKSFNGLFSSSRRIDTSNECCLKA